MSLGIGDSFNLTKNPISRTTLALFAGASGDHNPIHIDLDFVKNKKDLQTITDKIDNSLKGL